MAISAHAVNFAGPGINPQWMLEILWQQLALSFALSKMELPFFYSPREIYVFLFKYQAYFKIKIFTFPSTAGFFWLFKTKKNGFLTSCWPLCYACWDRVMFYTQSNVSEKRVSSDCDFGTCASKRCDTVDTTIVLFRGMESSFYEKRTKEEKKNDSVFCLFFFLKISHGNFGRERPGRVSGTRLRLKHCSLGQWHLWSTGPLTTSFILHEQPGHSKVACANAGHPSCHKCKYNQVNLTTSPCQNHSDF